MGLFKKPEVPPPPPPMPPAPQPSPSSQISEEQRRARRLGALRGGGGTILTGPGGLDGGLAVGGAGKSLLCQ